MESDRSSVAPPLEPVMGQRADPIFELREGDDEGMPAAQSGDAVKSEMRELRHAIHTLVQLLARQ